MSTTEFLCIWAAGLLAFAVLAPIGFVLLVKYINWVVDTFLKKERGR